MISFLQHTTNIFTMKITTKQNLAVLALVLYLIGKKPTKSSILSSLLSIYRNITLSLLNVKRLVIPSEQSAIEHQVTTGQAWDAYCDALKSAGAALIAPGTPSDPFNQAEGYRYLTRLLRGSLSAFLECQNYHEPKFYALANGDMPNPVKIGSDNPDNLYQSAGINNQFVYVLTVKRNTVHYLGFGLQAGNYGDKDGLRTVDNKESSDFEMVDGMIQILISCRRDHGLEKYKNWLRSDGEVTDGLVIVRQTFERRDVEIEAEISIKRIGEWTDGKFVEVNEDVVDWDERDRLTADHLVASLEKSVLFVAGASFMFTTWAKGFQKHVNQLPLFDVERSNRVGGDPAIRYYHSYWRVKEDECLIIKALPPKKLFSWNFQINNHWMESLDYRKYQIHVNKATAVYRADGEVCIVVCLHQPQVHLENKEYNWLCTTGHQEGTMCFRWIRPNDFENLPQPKTTLCKVSEINKYL
eukprot:maker-scaffold_19-snap-gene-6.0-mRNA-1 protein AED:0.01 eAED:0.01 QI:28/1/1/1/1/1/2/110/468